MNRIFSFSLFLGLLLAQQSLASAQCTPSCNLDGIGLYAWLGDGDSQSIGDATNDDNDGDDFIAFKNYSSVPVDISGWKLFTDEYQERTASWNPAFTFPAGTLLQPGQYVLVVAEWNGPNPLPLLWFNAGFNTGGEGLFEETSGLAAWAILLNSTTNQYITVHQQGLASGGESLPAVNFPVAVKQCNSNLTSLIPADFDGCETVSFNTTTCAFEATTDCSLPIFNSPCGQISNRSPQLSQENVSFAAPATGYDLTSLPTEAAPASTTLVWYTNAYHTGAQYSTPTNAGIGTYYGFYFNSTGNCYSASRQVTVSQALGLNFLNFTLRSTNDMISLNWETSLENNNKGFFIERSNDGEKWAVIGFVNSVSKQDNPDQLNSYSFYDSKPAPGKNFYRLKQVDFDGTYQYSSVQSILFSADKDNRINVYPSPANDHIKIKGADQRITAIKVFDIYGRRVMNLNEVNVKDDILILPIENLIAGQYIITLIGAQEVKSIKFIKQ